jgi:Caspase domain
VYFGHSEIYLRNNKRDLAIADLRQVLKLPARRLREREAQVRAAEMLTSLTSKADSTKPAAPGPLEPGAPSNAGAANSRMVALVIGNSAYGVVGELKNPTDDARVVAEALRRIGFSVLSECDTRENRATASRFLFNEYRLHTSGDT